MPARVDDGGNSSKGEEIEEAKPGECTGDEFRDRFPENEKGLDRPEKEGKEIEKGRNAGMLRDPPPSVGQDTEEDESPQNNPGEGEFCSSAFVAGCKGQSSHIAEDADCHENKNKNSRSLRNGEDGTVWFGSGVSGVFHGNRDRCAIPQEVEEAPAHSHGNDCERSPFVERGINDDGRKEGRAQ